MTAWGLGSQEKPRPSRSRFALGCPTSATALSAAQAPENTMGPHNLDSLPAAERRADAATEGVAGKHLGREGLQLDEEQLPH